MAKLMRKLKAILSPIGARGRQTDSNISIGVPCEIRLRMIGSVINIDVKELCMRAIAQDFAHCRIQDSSNIRIADPPIASWLDMDFWPPRRAIFGSSGQFTESKQQQRNDRHPGR